MIAISFFRACPSSSLTSKSFCIALKTSHFLFTNYPHFLRRLINFSCSYIFIIILVGIIYKSITFFLPENHMNPKPRGNSGPGPSHLKFHRFVRYTKFRNPLAPHATRCSKSVFVISTSFDCPIVLLFIAHSIGGLGRRAWNLPRFTFSR